MLWCDDGHTELLGRLLPRHGGLPAWACAALPLPLPVPPRPLTTLPFLVEMAIRKTFALPHGGPLGSLLPLQLPHQCDAAHDDVLLVREHNGHLDAVPPSLFGQVDLGDRSDGAC